MAGPIQLSNKQVKRAGIVLRRHMNGDFPGPSPDELRDAARTADAFRAVHRQPMLTARMGLRSCVISEGYEIGGDTQITQRLKRRSTIWDKLRREPDMNLARMHDIGGCRVVLPSLKAVERVSRRFTANSQRRNGKTDRIIDYVTKPRESGYRAVHIRTWYGGRRIEVQLRTPWQHLWARLIEDLTSRTGVDYKSGDGPPGHHSGLKSLGDLYAARDIEGPDRWVPDDELRALAEEIMELITPASAR
ncbi:RelA/SpoT domain-containing protein [Candidatus Poriferisodalis sp.]|uniref:RelA/SpoT domain-containing protein n=1 Tax=Candidatus Poriferisodalis sp. TaxID=3101277 RepID=UPI003B013B73